MDHSSTMKAMVFAAPDKPLELRTLAIPRPGAGQILMQVRACGVCRTDLHILDGELPDPKLPLIPGHQIVGTVVDRGRRAKRYAIGDRLGVPWLGGTCGRCRYCLRGRENLCEAARFTGYTIDGGFAEYTLADERFCFPLPVGYDDVKAAPLLCAGLIGYRAYRLAGEEVEHLGIYGFGAAAHIITQVAVYLGKRVYAFTRPGDEDGQAFARKLGAVWAGSSTERPPHELDASLIFAPVGSLVPVALQAGARGSVVVCGGIHMSDIPSFPYNLLWEERAVRSVANLTRRDGEELLALAPRVPIETHVTDFTLEQANEAIRRLRSGDIQGAAVLRIPARS